jgi:SulP family sulfate permease
MARSAAAKATTLPAGAAANILAGLVCGFVAVVASLGYGSLIFAAGLPEYLPVAAGIALFSTTVTAAVAALTSSARAVAANVQEVPAVALSGILATVAGAVAVGSTDNARLATVVVTIALATFATGAVALLLGSLRLGSIVRFIPYPVIGGFLAGTGWLIANGGVKLILGPVALAALADGAPDEAAVVRFGLALAFAVAVAAGRARFSNVLVLPAMILAGFVAFNLAAYGTGATPETLRDGGWLIELPVEASLWPPIDPGSIGLVDWSAVLAGALGIPTMIVITITAFLMNATGIELATRRDFDLDRELRSVGIMNLIAGAGGSAPGYYSVTNSILANRLGGSERLVGLTIAVVSLTALAFGTTLLNFVPTVVLGGLLLWIGGTQLYEWLVRSYRRLSHFEYLVIVLIFVVMVAINFAVGILVGIVAAVLLFAVEYGRIDIVRHEMTGADFQSGAEGVEKRRELLQRHGKAILIIRLQGYLFFGTAERLRHRVQERMLGPHDLRPKFLILDFRRVTGLDSSAVMSFTRLAQAAERERFTVMLTNLSENTSAALTRSGFSPETMEGIRIEPDIERGLRWCENRVIAEFAPEFSPHHQPIAEIIAHIVHDAAGASIIVKQCERLEVHRDQALIERGAPSDDIYFVETGHAAVEIPSEIPGRTIRVATVGPGAIVGEIAFYLGETRSASIVAEDDMIVWRFSRPALARLRTECPEAALHFHEGLAAILASRLATTNRVLRFLAD